MDLRAVLIGVILVVITGIGYLTFRMQGDDHKPVPQEGVTQTLPSSLSPSNSQSTPASLPPEQAVDSAESQAWYSLTDWVLRPAPAGWVDTARIVAGPSDPVASNSILQLSGWAGLADLGMRMEHVVLAACGKVFATVPVDGERADVATIAHPNLVRSGWVARIALAHVPDCADRTIAAFAVASVSRQAWPLQQGAHVGSVQAPSPDGPRLRAASRLLRPDDVGEVNLVDITVKATSLNMRSCANADCKALEKVGKGKYPGIVVDEANGWLLIQFEDKAGWMSKQYVTVQSR